MSTKWSITYKLNTKLGEKKIALLGRKCGFCDDLLTMDNSRLFLSTLRQIFILLDDGIRIIVLISD